MTTYTGNEENILEMASAYLADIAMPDGSTEVACEAAWVISLYLAKLADVVPTLTTTPRSEEETIAFTIAQRATKAYLAGSSNYEGWQSA